MGRRRDSSLDTAILSAAEACIAETGLATFTVEQVAERAGIPKSTLYKRWPTKTDLLHHVLANWVEQLNAERADIPTADMRAHLIMLVGQEIHVCQTRSGRAFAQLVLASFDTDSPESSPIVEAARSRREGMRTAVLDAISAGNLPHSIDCDVLLDLLLGAVWGPALAGTLPEPAYAIRLVDAILDGPATRPSLG